MAKTYLILRGILAANDVNQTQLARRLTLGRAGIIRRFCGSRSWEVNECYQILDMFGIEHSRLTEVFPPGGKNTLMQKGA